MLCSPIWQTLKKCIFCHLFLDTMNFALKIKGTKSPLWYNRNIFTGSQSELSSLRTTKVNGRVAFYLYLYLMTHSLKFHNLKCTNIFHSKLLTQPKKPITIKSYVKREKFFFFSKPLNHQSDSICTLQLKKNRSVLPKLDIEKGRVCRIVRNLYFQTFLHNWTSKVWLRARWRCLKYW